MSNSWARRDGESARAYYCFTKYLNAGSDRSVVSVYRQETGNKAASRTPGAWNLWVTKFDWQSRATAYDSHLQQLATDARAGANSVDDKKWAERRGKVREREFLASEDLLKKVHKILSNKRQKGTLFDAVLMLKLAFELQRRATEMEKHEQEHVAPMRFELVLK